MSILMILYIGIGLSLVWMMIPFLLPVVLSIDLALEREVL